MDSIVEILFHNAAKTPDALCLADRRGSLTYGEYCARIGGVAEALRAQGLKKGGRAVIRCTQDMDFLALLHGVQLAGGVAVPMEKGCAEARLTQTAEQTDAWGILSPADYAGLRAQTRDFPLPGADDVSLILFTTGTTGAPKGITLRHRADVAVAENIRYGTEMRAGNVEVCPMPLNHSAGLRRYFSNMLAGGAFIILDGLLAVKRFFEAIDTYGANSCALSPAALPLLFKLTGDRLAEYDGKLDFLSFGSAVFAEADREKLMALMPHTRLYDLYGSTEAGVSCVSLVSGPDAAPRCIGRPSVNARLKILDDTGAEKAAMADDPGLLAWGGAMLADGYWRDEALTEKTFANGYVRTNDLGYMDAAGRVFLLGRADDVVNVGGRKIAPGEVEEEAKRCSGVADCACIGIKDPLSGEALALFYEGEQLEERILREHLRAALEPYKLPSRITWMQALPRTYNGKLDRKALRGMSQGSDTP